MWRSACPATTACRRWPPVGDLINNGANGLLRANTPVAVFLYRVVERSLLPFGLHHIWNVPFFYTLDVGGWSDCQGILTCFFKGHSASGVLGGGFLFKMFGLPGAALAIWRTAKPENRVRVGSIMLSAALTSFLTGITEPLEFAFLFVAPVLYVAHAVLAGLSFPIMYLAGARLGYTFSQGAIDFGLFYATSQRPWLVLIPGPLYLLLYFVVIELLRRGDLEHRDALRVHAAEHVLDRPVLSGGVQRLENDQDAVGVLVGQPHLVLGQHMVRGRATRTVHVRLP